MPLALLLLLSAGSGVAALIYEIVWFQLLELVIGSTAVSLGVLLATFMGGTCLGSLMLPPPGFLTPPSFARVRCDRTGHRRFRAVRVGPDAAGGARLHRVERIWLVARRGCGGLPSASHHADGRDASCPGRAAGQRGVAWLGFLYGSNIAGAVLGCLLSGFYLLPSTT